MLNIEDYMTVTEAAKILGVTPNTLRNWDKNGKLKALRNPYSKHRLYKKETVYGVLDKIEQSLNEQEYK